MLRMQMLIRGEDCNDSRVPIKKSVSNSPITFKGKIPQSSRLRSSTGVMTARRFQNRLLNWKFDLGSDTESCIING